MLRGSVTTLPFGLFSITFQFNSLRDLSMSGLVIS